MLSRIHVALSVLFLLVVPSVGQTLVEGELIVADRGVNNDGSDGGVRRYTHNGAFLGSLPTNGSGQVRGIAAHPSGDIYVARGNEVVRYLFPGDTVDPTAFATGSKVQDVCVDWSTGDVWCSFGTLTSATEIRQYDEFGALQQTITDAAIVHPRSIAISRDGTLLLVANSSGQNVLAIDLTPIPPLPPVISTYATTSGLNPIGITLDREGVAFITGAYGLIQEILELTPDGMGGVTQSLFLDFSSLTDFNAPAGIYADKVGNVFIANRSVNGGVSGAYPVSTSDTTLFPAAIGSEHINSIDLCHRLDPLTVTINTPHGLDGAGIPQVLGMGGTVTIDIDAPDHPGQLYAVVMSMMLIGNPAGCTSDVPLGFGTQVNPFEPRRLPLFSDLILAQSFAALAAGGSGALSFQGFLNNMAMPLCPNTVDGSLSGMSFLLDGTGHGVATVQLPTCPIAMGIGVPLYFGVAVAVVDTGSVPLGIDLLSDQPSCFVVIP